ncbi:UNKNOWN [Stylonychia lemnae]|uniref:VPS9 domain-containing protein n=1 Tax=Stylonychia lemnae TaxID=5949 RepID=A0A078A8Q6_STYLE|nr:UNKNOWN [Stylonychia lemnae]|eukprot:CDW77176.1 UNKNOWN [Stylonychia lemnae]
MFGNKSFIQTQRKSLRQKKDKFIRSMINDQLVLAQFNKDANNEIISTFKEQKVRSTQSWKDFSVNYIKRIQSETEEIIKQRDYDIETDLEFYRNRLILYKNLSLILQALEVNIHEWQDKPFYKNYMLYSYIVESDQIKKQIPQNKSQIQSSSMIKLPCEDIPFNRLTTAPIQKINGAGIISAPMTPKIPHRNQIEAKRQLEEKKDQEILNEIIKQLNKGLKKRQYVNRPQETQVVLTTQHSPRSGGSPKKITREQEPINIVVEVHPIKLLATAFSKNMHDIYKPMFATLLAAFNDINELLQSQQNNQMQDMNKINYSADMYFSFNDNSNLIKRGTTFNYKANPIDLKQKQVKMTFAKNDKNLNQHFGMSLQQQLEHLNDALEILIRNATEEVKLFLETSLVFTSYFYRKSINIAFDKFASAIIEVITKIVFESNDSVLFQMFFELYKLQNIKEIQSLKEQIECFKDVKLADLNVYFKCETHYEFGHKVTQDTDKNSKSHQNKADFELLVQKSKEKVMANSEVKEPIKRSRTQQQFQSIKIEDSKDQNQNIQKQKQETMPQVTCDKKIKPNLMFKSSVIAMKRLSRCKDPLQILDNLMKIYQQISQQFSIYKQKDAILIDQNLMNLSSTDQLIQADDFVAILIYVIIKADATDIIPYMELIKAFTLNKRQFTFEYMKASLLGSIEFICINMDEHVKLSREIADDLAKSEDLKMQFSNKLSKHNRFDRNSTENNSIKSFVQEAVDQFVQKSVKLESLMESSPKQIQIEII